MNITPNPTKSTCGVNTYTRAFDTPGALDGAFIKLYKSSKTQLGEGAFVNHNKELTTIKIQRPAEWLTAASVNINDINAIKTYLGFDAEIIVE